MLAGSDCAGVPEPADARHARGVPSSPDCCWTGWLIQAKTSFALAPQLRLHGSLRDEAKGQSRWLLCRDAKGFPESDVFSQFWA